MTVTQKIQNRTGMSLDKFSKVLEIINETHYRTWSYVSKFIEGIKEDYDFENWNEKDIASVILDIEENTTYV